MSKKTRKKKIKVEVIPSIDFDSWFWFKVRDKKVNDWQKAEIKVFFNGKGLKDKETKLKYDKTLELY